MAARILRHGFALSIAALLTAIVAVSVFLVLVALPDITRTSTAAVPSPSPSPSGRGAMADSPLGIQMSPDADCAACHLTSSGVGTKTIPVMAHPLWGWRDCTACHANDRLVKTAPGHTGLHKDDCLVCHKAPEAAPSAAPRPHHIYEDKPCVACHGSEAPLPTAMAGRQDCWICHGGTEFKDLFGSPAPSAPLPWPSEPAASPGASAPAGPGTGPAGSSSP